MPRRFLILAQSRSGTQLLRALLDSHPAITCEGELLHHDLQYTNYRLRRELLRVYPDGFFQRRAECAPVYGFNLMFYHLRFPAATLRRLANRGWRVIHLMREDLLDIALSYLVAERTGVWHRKGEGEMPSFRLRIPVQDLEIELRKRKRWRSKELGLVSGLSHLPLRYERDLADSSRWQQTCDRVFQMLGLDTAPVHSSLLRTDPRALDQIIENHPELMDWVGRSKYRQLVEH